MALNLVQSLSWALRIKIGKEKTTVAVFGGVMHKNIYISF